VQGEIDPDLLFNGACLAGTHAISAICDEAG
jgi:hypothetical protein